MTQLLSRAFFQTAYDEMENDLRRRSESNALCEYCTQKGIPSIFKPIPNQPSVSEVKSPHGQLVDLPSRKNCPFCRVLCHLMENGAGNNCCGDCRYFYSPRNNPDVNIDVRICPQPHRRVGAVAVFNLPEAAYCNYHVAHGDLHFVHPTQADHFRIKEWIDTCDASHASCTEGIRAPDGLFGHGKYALRLIDVEARMIVKSLHPVRYITLSYVWGASANRKFAMIPNPRTDKSAFPRGIEPLDEQIPEMMYGRLSRTFEDLICFTRRIGERYIWIDAICIPQDGREPDILAHQLALMDQIYFHSTCNVVSLTSGVEDGLPGASSASPRDTRQLVEQFPGPDGRLRIATPLWELYPYIQYAPWVTRGWTLQEHLLAKRSIFFTPQEAIFVCKGMSAKESWRCPRTATDIEYNDKTERWYEYNIPLPSGPRGPLSPELTTTLSTIVQMYTTRHLTFVSDKFKAFQGLSARLSETYKVEFLHAHPVSSIHFVPSLLWGRLDFRDDNKPQQPTTSNPILRAAEEDWPSWSWLSHPAAVAYKYWSPWTDKPDFPTYGPLSILPKTEIHIQRQDNKFHPLPLPGITQWSIAQPTSSSPVSAAPRPGSGLPPTSTPGWKNMLEIKGLSLDINIDEWPTSKRRNLPNAMQLWENKDYPTARGKITFNIVVVPDGLPSNGNQGFPLGTTTIRLLHVGGGGGSGVGDLRPKMPLLLRRGEGARLLTPNTSTSTTEKKKEKGERGEKKDQDLEETDFSNLLDWVEPDYSSKNNYLGVEPDLCLLIVDAADPLLPSDQMERETASVPVKRLGIAFVRVMDFLVAGARVRQVFLN